MDQSARNIQLIPSFVNELNLLILKPISSFRQIKSSGFHRTSFCKPCRDGQNQ